MTVLRNGVRQARLRLGLSQHQLAARAGVTRQAIGAIEAGLSAPSTAVALRLARALGCRVEDLFWLDDEGPEIEAEPVTDGDALDLTSPVPCALMRAGDRWLAHPLRGERAFVTGLVPADGLAFPEAAPSPGTGRTSPVRRWRVRLLDRPEALAQAVTIAGCAPELSLWAQTAETVHGGVRVRRLEANSVTALKLVGAGAVHAAGVHLLDLDTGDHNVPFVRRWVPGRRVVLIHLGVWEEGLVVARGNPMRLRSAADLADPGVVIVNREPGAGSRHLLEQQLAAARVPAQAVRGFGREVNSHVEVAQAVARGEAHAGVSTRSVAQAFGLDFVPWRAVRYDLVVPKDYLDEPSVQALLGTLSNRWVRSRLETLGGFDTSRTGEILFDSDHDPAAPGATGVQRDADTPTGGAGAGPAAGAGGPPGRADRPTGPRPPGT